MDNRKWYKKIATIFWWVLTFLPLLVALIYFIGYHLTFNSGIATATELASYQANSYGNFGNILEANIDIFTDFGINYLTTMFDTLFTIIGVNSTSMLATLFGWMLSIQVYHLLFDSLVFFIHLLHSYLDCERWQR